MKYKMLGPPFIKRERERERERESYLRWVARDVESMSSSLQATSNNLRVGMVSTEQRASSKVQG